VTSRTLLPALLLALLLPLAGCAVNNAGSGSPSAYSPPPQPAARIGLPPAYRAFFDELKDDGDWTLIEPYGWVFRPRVNFDAWRPYQEGWWEPSDYYGWIWNSTESFGWITYHYGTWFYDEYQGWVWAPGPVWGPAWVAWVSAGGFVGWAPLAPSGYDGYDKVPGGVFTYASATSIADRDVGSQSMFVTHLPEIAGTPREIVNLGHVENVAFNRGPDVNDLRRLGAAVPIPQEPSELPRVKLSAPVRSNESELRAGTTRLVAEALREQRAFRERGQNPPPAPAFHAPPPAPMPDVREKPAPEPAVTHEAAPAPAVTHEAAPAPAPARVAPTPAPAGMAPRALADTLRLHRPRPAAADSSARHRPKVPRRPLHKPAARDSTRKS